MATDVLNPDQSRSTCAALWSGTQWPCSAWDQSRLSVLAWSCVTLPHSSNHCPGPNVPSSMDSWLSACGVLKLSEGIAAALGDERSFWFSSICLSGCSHSSFFPTPPAWIRGRRKEPPSIEVPPSMSILLAVLMAVLWGNGYRGGK